MTNLTRMYVLVNTDHYMSPGKIAAQVAHATSRLYKKNSLLKWPQAVITVRASSEQLTNIAEYMEEEGIKFHKYIDEGVNEVPPYTATVIAVEPLNEEDTRRTGLYKDFKLL